MNNRTFHGLALLKAIQECNIKREPLIENLFYKKTSQMTFAPDGIGKSLVNIQECVQGTITGAKVFGEFLVPKAFNTLYLQMERPPEENLERLKTMIAKTAFDPARFVLTTEFQDFNFANDDHVKAAMKRIKDIIASTFSTVDRVDFDPIYPMVPGGLSQDDCASYITSFSRRVQNEFECSTKLVHHTNRGQKDKETGARFGKDMYGSYVLAAHCSGIYHLKPYTDGTILKLEKSSYSNLEKEIRLIYDKESQLSFVEDVHGKLSKSDRLMNYISLCKSKDLTFTFDDLQTNSGLSTSFLRGEVGGHLKSSLKEFGKSSNGKILYKVVNI